MSDPGLTRRRARVVWRIALGASVVALASAVPVFVLAHWVGNPPFFATVIVTLAVAAIPVMLVAALVAGWLWLSAGDTERRRAIEAARAAQSPAPRRDRDGSA